MQQSGFLKFMLPEKDYKMRFIPDAEHLVLQYFTWIANSIYKLVDNSITRNISMLLNTSCSVFEVAYTLGYAAPYISQKLLRNISDTYQAS